ncbi:hypothetical protein VD0002_g5147 [Verticillium dahliae]|uniref:Uncharacterized protein n=2 Tax=Verticillium dahliae TaxID=27337 RepID=G2XFK5_VERDV|nr:uncharacterized protein VDAG_09129 [Verticillium dahliae VdLs.17]KAH6705829.1 hypothetical protein EV126DRAFT_379465 [Verticillium dahliae]EGY18603.1 hypothetical protein VDAG_09129 [Verticillium dahliae VdLs.17]PNH27229.1 hypothetical protein BJF96_g9480 [Verticillium dahliae]PNH49013.1 hypothetical protein VD0003_g8124 [Verticillium dahliae]PNH63098.1 hypothetical protein VD0002_g5147 [Verticillium dahliae]
MSPVADCSSPSRPTIRLAEGPVDQMFIKNAVTLADQNPKWSGVFFAKFLGGYYEQVALGNCSDEGDAAMESSSLRDPETEILLHRMYLRAAENYRQCHQLQDAATDLEVAGIDGSAYLTDLVEVLKRNSWAQAEIAAGIIRDARCLKRLRIEQSTRK